MPRPPTPVHYLRPNDKVWTPPAVMYLDTEAEPIPGSDPEVLKFRLWAATVEDRKPRKSGQQLAADGWGVTVEGMADWINQQTKGRPTLWIFAHNLSFDLAVTRLPLLLIARGWTITDMAIGGRSPWMRFVHGSKHLTVVDSGSWLPMPLADIGDAIGIGKPPLPPTGSTDADWLERCAADVAILRQAMNDLMGWWDREQLGRWTITGGSCGWNAYRHVPTMQRVVIDPDSALVQADRMGVHGGRRGVWRVGQIRVGELLELDFEAAYPTVAASLPLPVRRGHHVDSLALDDFRIVGDRWGFLGEVTIATETPRYPVRVGGATFYPVGTFKAHLAGPDVTDAARAGTLLAVHSGWVHQLGHNMLPWARWCLSVQSGALADTPAAARLAAKNWGRAVIGKWAARSFEKIELGPSPVADWGYEDGWDHASQTRGGMVDIGGRRWWVAASATPDNAYPGILAWVEAHVRVRLSHVIDTLGPDTVVQCDTDGLIVHADGLAAWVKGQHPGAEKALSRDELISYAVAELNKQCDPLRLRVKRRYDEALVLGPQHVDAGGKRRFAGLPAHATRNDEGKYVAKIWPKLQWQMSKGDTRGYVRPEVTSLVVGPFANGWVTTTGRVVPVRCIIDRDGQTQILPWGFMPEAQSDIRLAPVQHPYLTQLSGDFPLIG